MSSTSEQSSKREAARRMRLAAEAEAVADGRVALTLEVASAMVDEGTAPHEVVVADAEFRRACYMAWSAKNVQNRQKMRLAMRRAALALTEAFARWGVR